MTIGYGFVVPMHILVTGSAGFIGSHLSEALLANNDNVVGIDCFDPFYPRATKEQNLAEVRATAQRHNGSFEFHELDVHALTVENLKRWKIERVYHLAAKAGVRPSLEDPLSYVTANVSATVHLLEICRRAGIRDIVLSSSSSVYGNTSQVPFTETDPCLNPISPYAASKRSAELMASTFSNLYGLRIAVLRIFTVFGPRQRPDLAIHKFARSLKNGQPITLFGDGSTERDYTYVADVVAGQMSAAHWLLQQPPGTCEIFNIGNSHPVRLSEMIRILSAKLQIPAELKREPAQPGDVERTWANVSKAESALGYKPQVEFATGVGHFVNWFLRVGPPTNETSRRSEPSRETPALDLAALS